MLSYDRHAERLVREDRLDAVPDAEDVERYKSEIRYGMGSGWTTAADWAASSGGDGAPADPSAAK